MSFGLIPIDPDAVSEDLILGGRLRILQPRRGHRIGHDAILLAAACGAQPGEHILDLGAGVGAAGLALACRVPGARVTFLEIDPFLTALAQENIARNGFADLARVMTCDISSPHETRTALNGQTADRIMMNPPFNDPGRHRSSPDPRRRLAHAAALGLPEWIDAAGRMLAPQGELVLIWRADGLGEVLAGLTGAFGTVAVRPVYPRPSSPAIRVLVRAVRGGRGPLEILPGLCLNDETGKPSVPAEAVLRRAAALPFVANEA